jgi:hypothetical protein
MRAFLDGTEGILSGTTAAQGKGNGHAAVPGYTWDDDPSRARPYPYDYLIPAALVWGHR